MERRLPVPGEQAVMDGALEAALLAPEREQSVGRGWGREAKPATKIKRKERGGGAGKPKLLPTKLGRVFGREASLGGSSLGLRSYHPVT